MAARTKLTDHHFRRIYERTDDDADTFQLGEEDMGPYFRWVNRCETSRLPSWDARGWKARVLSTNYHDPKELDMMLWLQQGFQGTRVVIGQFNGHGYRVVLGRAILKPTVPPTSDFAALMPPELLGFVRNVSVGTPTVGNLRRNEPNTLASEYPEHIRKDSVANVDTTSAIGNDDTGFLFFQLGQIESANEEQWSKYVAGAAEKDVIWEKSPHVLCVKVKDSGRPTGVYLMPTKHIRSHKFKRQIHIGMKISSGFDGVGGPTWFFNCIDEPNEINPLYELVAAVTKQHVKGPRVVREYVPWYPGELEQQEPESAADVSSPPELMSPGGTKSPEDVKTPEDMESPRHMSSSGDMPSPASVESFEETQTPEERQRARAWVEEMQRLGHMQSPRQMRSSSQMQNPASVESEEIQTPEQRQRARAWVQEMQRLGHMQSPGQMQSPWQMESPAVARSSNNDEIDNRDRDPSRSLFESMNPEDNQEDPDIKQEELDDDMDLDAIQAAADAEQGDVEIKQEEEEEVNLYDVPAK